MKVKPPFTYLGRVDPALLAFWIILTPLGDLYTYGFILLSILPGLWKRRVRVKVEPHFTYLGRVDLAL